MEKNYKGGYQLINFGGVSLSDSEASVPGVYEAIEATHRKPLIFTGLVIDGAEKGDLWANVVTNSGNYVATISGLGTITITNADMVTFAAGG